MMISVMNGRCQQIVGIVKTSGLLGIFTFAADRLFVEGANIDRVKAFVTWFGFELNRLARLQSAVAIHDNRGIMGEKILFAVICEDKSIAFGVVEPFDFPGLHCDTSLFVTAHMGQWLGGNTLKLIAAAVKRLECGGNPRYDFLTR
ncbi:hypothetical protein [Oceanobacter mangrovi]|uniref:hypothetical protein n=1 Tax=Oceanobacter mangrovi TaxID=2862510 RepID=UPI003CCED7BE